MTDEKNVPATLAVVQPAQPKNAAPEDVAALQAKATEIATELQTRSEDRAFVNSIMNLGAEAQQRAGRKLELLKGRVGTMMNELEGEGSQIPKNLVEMRLVLDKINPHVVQKAGLISRMLGKVPGVGDRLKQIAVQYESVQTQIDAIVTNLRNGKDELIRDNIALEQLYEDLQQEQKNVQKNAYLGELLLQKLEEQAPLVTDPAQQKKLQAVTHAVAMRVQDLRTMEQVNNQFFLSIDLTCDNNHLLAQSVDRTLTVTTNVITVGLAIAQALAKQKKTIEAVKATQDYAGQILAQNAAAIRQQTADIQSLYQDPVLALEYIQKGFDDLLGAIGEVENAKAAGVEAAKKGIAQLSAMNRQLAEKVDATHAGKISSEAKSIEA